MSENFIKQEYIFDLLDKAKDASDSFVNSALDRAERGESLTHADVAALLKTENPEFVARIFDIAGKIKKRIYGNRIVMFAPVYVSDFCVNRCAYCSFNHTQGFQRRKLTMDELCEEVRILETMGHKRLALEAGEHDGECPIDYILECIKTIYGMKFENGEIRRINVNIAATTTENYRKLKAAQIGTYILFQETYHEGTYEKYHLAGPKKDYMYHLSAFDRAMEAGIDDVGGGVLFGLGDPYFDVMGLLLHNEHLEKKFNAGFHTISVPRLCPAKGMNIKDFPNIVDDDTFAKLVAVIRIAVPFTGMILSTRENHEMRKRLLKAGISQISAGSSTEVGGYKSREQGAGSREQRTVNSEQRTGNSEQGAVSSEQGEQAQSQFSVNDERSAISIISELMDDGYIPSFCTACYRGGRTGDRFMSLAKSGQIGNVCLPNALMTLCEYSMDYGDDTFRQKADSIIEKEILQIANNDIKLKTIENIGKIREGVGRDFFI